MKNKIAKAIFETILYAIIVVVLMFGIPRAMSYVLKTPYPMATITSESMWPELKKNDLVFIAKVEKRDLRVGDIIVYKNERGFTIHRIMSIETEKLITKGDANNIADRPIRYDEIIGRTVNYGNSPLKIPYIGSITIWAASLRS